MAETKVTSTEIAPGTWVTPSLGTGWAGFDAGGGSNYGFPQYYKDSLGFVHFRGLAKNTTGAANNSGTNGIIFTLPAGLRPIQTMRMVAPVADVFGEVDIKNDGTVIISGPTSVPSGGTGWIDLNAVLFFAEA